ncbi:hypothetical protein AX774_g4311 [Zancudomyces culisetae]|uniref:Uncharacterized protein n=1 Tax=Zancudomyces culisetae TaxID=1213189 RepID=A0A1R1PML9_ZANCU|nr:hypothetical protein AX774_g4311 [Zancudomyces culisetae]|eukprot:OMH82214.1 hypothetical protein AX774_g4311 [Zancudomyces culisetae]
MTLFEILDIRSKREMNNKAYYKLNSMDRQFISMKKDFELSDIIDMLSTRKNEQLKINAMRRPADKQLNTLSPNRVAREPSNFVKNYKKELGIPELKDNEESS